MTSPQSTFSDYSDSPHRLHTPLLYIPTLVFLLVLIVILNYFVLIICLLVLNGWGKRLPSILKSKPYEGTNYVLLTIVFPGLTKCGMNKCEEGIEGE